MITTNPRMYRSKTLHEIEDPLSAYGPVAQSCVAEAAYHFALTLGIEPNEQTIEKKLRELNAVDPQRTARQFEYHLCDAIGRKMVLKQKEIFKAQFENTGIISFDEIETSSKSIDRVFSGNGKFSSIPNAKQLLLSETLSEIEKIDLPMEQKNLAQRFFSPLSMFYGKSPEVILTKNRLKTIELVKQSMHKPMPSTTDALWGENEKWDEPEDLTLSGDSSAEFSDSDYDLKPVKTLSLYPNLDRFEIRPIESRSLYPCLSDTNTLFTPFDQNNLKSCEIDRTWVTETPIVTDPGFKLHFRISYIDLACADVIKKNQSDQTTWDSLPGIIQKDALMHCIHLQSCQGSIEELACRLFKSINELQMQLRLSRLKSFPVKTTLSEKFIKKGEELLLLYYSDKYNTSSLACLDFYEELLSLPKETLFFQYVYEMAVAAGIHIEPWDHNYAENHWRRIDMICLSIQALERCLHTTKGV